MEGYEDYGEVYTFYILEYYQNMHYGIKMFNKTFEELKKAGFDKIVVT